MKKKTKGWQRVALLLAALLVLIAGSGLAAYLLRDRYPETYGKWVDMTHPYIFKAKVGWLKDEMQIVYPWAARQRNAEGSVVLAIVVEADGRISASRVDTTSGTELLDATVLDAAQHFKVDPARLGADQFPFEKKLKVTFRMEDAQ